jgi:hypothetical protein
MKRSAIGTRSARARARSLPRTSAALCSTRISSVRLDRVCSRYWANIGQSLPVRSQRNPSQPELNQSLVVRTAT